MNKDKQDEEVKKKVFTLFILFFPSIIIAIIPSSFGNLGSIWLPLALKLLLVFYQLIVLKNFIDSHYES